jgi:hypothetical protein
MMAQLGEILPNFGVLLAMLQQTTFGRKLGCYVLVCKGEKQ